METESKNPVCNVCGKTFSKNAYLNKHLKNVHKINSKGQKLLDVKFTCVLCDRKFNTKFCLERHITAIHFVDAKTSFNCDQCGYETLQKNNLKRHMQKHNKLRPERPLKCSHCNASFKYFKHLNYHEKKNHSIFHSKRASVKRKCPMCSFVSTKKRRHEINNHFKEVHSIPLRWEAYSFDNLDLFNEWKSILEKSTTAFYREKDKSKHYVCHRSGSFKTNRKGLRNMKIMGSSKINAFCPSEIKVDVQPNGRVDVKYMPCHVGHNNELKYIRLTSEDKNKIATQLLNKTPHDFILTGIRTSLRNCDLQRIHLATKKDISNIERSLNLNNEAVKHPYDPIKHIHLVATSVRENNVISRPTVSEEKNELVIDFHEETIHPFELEPDILIEVCADNSKRETLQNTFKEEIDKFVNFLHESAKSEEQMEYVQNIMRQTMSTVAAMASASG